MPSVQGPESGQQPMALLTVSAAQCEPARQVAGRSGSPPIQPQMVLRSRWSSCSAGEDASAGHCGNGAGVATMGHATTSSSRRAIVLVSRGSAWLKASWRSVDEARRAADRGRAATIIFAGWFVCWRVMLGVWRKNERVRQKKRERRQFRKFVGNRYGERVKKRNRERSFVLENATCTKCLEIWRGRVAQVLCLLVSLVR